MIAGSGRYFTFGPYRLDPEQRLLFRGDTEILLTPRTFETLRVLVENHGRVLTKEDLLSAVWPDTVVEENNLTQNVSRLRKVLTGAPNGGAFIETLPRRGYRFVAPVEEHTLDRPEILLQRHTSVRFVREEELEEEEEEGQAQPGAAEVPAEIGSPLLRPPATRARWMLLATASLAAVGVAALALVTREVSNRDPDRSTQIRIERLTASGRVVAATISRDGQYVAFAADAAGQQSLWVRQISTESDLQIVPGAAVDYWGLTFAHDGRFIYYVAWERNKTEPALYRVPLLGGLPKLVLRGASTPIDFSPDGREIAFAFHDQLAIGSADGGQPRIVHRPMARNLLFPAPSGPAWSPDGSRILLVMGDDVSSGREQRLVELRLDDGGLKTLHEGPWLGAGRAAWRRDGRGLLMTASDRAWAPRQIWHISHPGGRATQVTSDLHDYASVSLTLDNDTIAAVQTHTLSDLWLRDESGHERLLASEVGDRTGAEGFSWTPDGAIVYAARSGGHLNLWRASATGGPPRQLTVDAGNNFHPCVSPDGRTVVFASDRGGAVALWRMGLDGSHVAPLTHGREAVRPSISPDGSWVVYQEGHGWVRSDLWKVPIGGGKGIALTGQALSIRPAVSPDGQLVAYFEMDAQDWHLAVIPLDGGRPLATFAIPATRTRVVRWTRDGKGLAYIDDRDDSARLLVQPLDGGPPAQLTTFPPGKIVTFGWSPDGRQLVYVRETRSSDVVRLRNFARWR